MEENINKFIVRPAGPKDSKRIWEIRNHPEARENSGNSEVIPFANHLKWFENKYFKEPGNFCFVLEEKNRVIGYCRFDHDKNGKNFVISIAVDYDFQGGGRGSFLLKSCLAEIEPQKKVILAEIKKGNEASARLFKKNGFVIYKEHKDNYYLKY